MVYLFGALFLILIPLTVAVFIQPKLLNFKRKPNYKPHNPWKLLLFGIGAIFLSIMGIGISAPPVPHDLQSKDQSESKVKESDGKSATSTDMANILSNATGESKEDAQQATNTVLGNNFNSNDTFEEEAPVSKEEAQALDSGSIVCPDDTKPSCLTQSPFIQYIFKRYPDIKQVKFKPDEDIKSDPETYSMYAIQFYQGLYFAKLIKLANGQSLFDFLKTCSSKFDPLNSAEFDVSAKDKRFYLQFFPHLKMRDTGEIDDMNMLYFREGDKFIPKSPGFSLHALRDPNFMDEHNVECAK